MAIVPWGYETGSNNDTLDATNSGADVVVATGGTAIISTAHPAHGTRAAKFTATTTSGGCYQSKTLSGTVTDLAVRVYFYFEVLPNASTGMLVWLGLGSSQAFHVEMTSTGAIRIRDDANTALWDGSGTLSTGVIAINTHYYMDVAVHASATTGTYRVAVYPADSSTPVTGMDSGVRTNINTGTGYSTIRIGPKPATGTVPSTVHVDDWAYNEGSTALIGQYTEVLATPTVVVTGHTDPTTVGGTDGTIAVTWAPITGAASYDAAVEEGTVSSGFVATDTGVTSPYTFTGLSAGPYTVAIRAKA